MISRFEHYLNGCRACLASAVEKQIENELHSVWHTSYELADALVSHARDWVGRLG